MLPSFLSSSLGIPFLAREVICRLLPPAGSPSHRTSPEWNGVSTTSLVYSRLCGKARPFARGSLSSVNLQGGVSTGPELSLRGRRERAPLCSRRLLRSLNPRELLSCMRQMGGQSPRLPARRARRQHQ